MSGIISEFLAPAITLRLPLAVIATGIAIKLLDDQLDQARDAAAHRFNWAQCLGSSVTAYALVALSVAMLLADRTAFSLFAAAYAVGMAGDWRRTMPSGLPGWLESKGMLAICVLTLGWAWTLWGLVTIGAIQAWDHAVDGDGPWPRPVYILTALACTSLALALHPALSAMALAAALPFVLPRPLPPRLQRAGKRREDRLA